MLGVEGARDARGDGVGLGLVGTGHEAVPLGDDGAGCGVGQGWLHDGRPVRVEAGLVRTAVAAGGGVGVVLKVSNEHGSGFHVENTVATGLELLDGRRVEGN